MCVCVFPVLFLASSGRDGKLRGRLPGHAGQEEGPEEGLEGAGHTIIDRADDTLTKPENLGPLLTLLGICV